MKRAEQNRTLSIQEAAFVDAYASPPWPTIADAAAIAGYNETYARQVARKPHVMEAIQARIEEHKKGRDVDIQRLLAKLLERAVADKGQMREKNAELFLEAVGMLGRGTKIVTSVTQNAGNGDGFEDRLRSVARSRVSADLTRNEE